MPKLRRAVPFTRQMLLLQVALLVAVVGIGFGVQSWQLHRSMQDRFEQRALDVARSVASRPGLGDAVARDDRAIVAAEGAAAGRATGALFVVVTDERGIRLAHPNPAEIGRPVSTSPAGALAGQEVVAMEHGTLGLSARGKVPLRDTAGRIVGEVSVGFDANDVTAASIRMLGAAGLLLAVALVVGVGGTLLLVRLLKRRTFGLEPAEVADLVREREAVLHGISDGVVALDTTGAVTMANAGAARLIDPRLGPGVRPAELDLPEALRRIADAPTGRPTLAALGDRVLVATHRTVAHQGRPLGSVITVLDRTEVENLTDELGAVRMMTRALRAQRHEFANRMHTVHGLLHGGDPAEAAEYVDALLDAPDVQVADCGDALAPATLRAYLSGAIAGAAEQGVELRLSDESRVPRKLTAPVEVITVLGNLVDNAVEAAREAPVRPARVLVDLLADGTALVVAVSNTGAGISAERRAALFADAVTGHGPDRGLGLGIVRSTLAALGGTVEITEPGGAGVMTVFVARIPGVLQPAEAVPT